MELRDLRYFLACVDEGNVTRAGRVVHAAQPTLSHAIRRLEQEARTRLLERRPRHKVRPTPAGALLAARARRTLETLRGFDDDLAALQGLATGSLRVAAIQSLAVTLLPPALALYARKFEGVAIDAHVAPADEILAAVRDGRADVGLVAGPAPTLPKFVTAERLHREPFVAVVRAADPLARRASVPLAALKLRPFVLVPASSPTGAIIHAAFAAAGLVPRIRLTMDSGEALRELVRAGVGVTILPARYLQGTQPGLRAVRLVRPTPWREVFALRSAGEPSSAAAAFLALLRAQPTPAVPAVNAP
ncbi:MAG: LysR substrate-binding domain-containing protein [Pseudomonadota bacterium]